MAAADQVVLARRYRRLMVAYPAHYRSRRADEILGTLLDLAPPGRRRPTLAEAADLIAGGVRHRWGSANAWDFAESLAMAGPVALALAAGLSGFLWLTVEPVPDGTPLLRGYLTTGPTAYATWLVAAVGWTLLPERWARTLVAAATVTSAALIPVAAGTSTNRPPLWTIMMLLGFGALVLAAPRRGDRLARFGVLVGAAVTAAVAKALLTYWLPADRWWTGYYTAVLYLAGLVVAIAALAVAGAGLLGAARGRRLRPALWAALLLALPGGWLGPLSNASGTADGSGIGGSGIGGSGFAGTSFGGTGFGGTGFGGFGFGGTGFGRSADVLLATCLVSAAVLALRSVPADADRAGALGRAGAVATGFAAGLAGFLWAFGAVHDLAVVLAWTCAAAAWQWLPVPARRVAAGVAVAATAAAAGGQPATVSVTFALLGVVAFLRPGGHGWHPPAVAVAAFGAAALVASYDNDWHRYPWPLTTHTAELVLNLGMVPFTAAALAGARAARIPGTRLAGAVAVLAGAGWIAGRTVPDLPFWAPSLLLVPAGALVLVLVRALGMRPSPPG